MNTQAKTALVRIQSGFNHHLFADGKINDLFVFDDNTTVQKIKKEVQRIVRPGKITRCFICISCNQPRTPRKMSKLINICRECLNEAKTKGRIAQNNFINRLANTFAKSLRREVGKYA